MSIEIVRRKNQLVIRSEYNDELIAIIRQCEEREWRKSTREWLIPLDKEEWLIEQLEEADIQVKYSKDIAKQEVEDVSIERNAGKLELKFNKYCEEFPLFRAISHSFYDKNTRTLSFPEKQENNLLSVLKDSKVTYKFAKQKAIKEKYSKQKPILKKTLGKIKVNTKKYKETISKKQNESDNEVTDEEMDQDANDDKNQKILDIKEDDQDSIEQQTI
jgi:hypothetical protein